VPPPTHAHLLNFSNHQVSFSLSLSSPPPILYLTSIRKRTPIVIAFICPDRLTVTYSRSSGPGGQHVNKVNTKAEIRFHVQTADWIPDDVRNKIIIQNKNRINKVGELLVTSEASRSQQQNLNDCLQKIQDIIAEASQKPHEPTEEDIAIRRARLDYMNKERLKQKKIHSVIKQSRKVDFD
uniref:Large ribosomal subunit protein mL62 n=1 Tax=Paramormyrops kingsleyae TaxID=1676925 RepID=A0A3B3RU38_9TELE